MPDWTVIDDRAAKRKIKQSHQDTSDLMFADIRKLSLTITDVRLNHSKRKLAAKPIDVNGVGERAKSKEFMMMIVYSTYLAPASIPHLNISHPPFITDPSSISQNGTMQSN